MAKKQPEIYNPGDLDRTRSNLGELSREEAERMASVLGGEVGREKTDDDLARKYDRLRKTASGRPYAGRQKTERGASSPKPARTTPPGSQASASSAYSGHYVRKKNQPRKIGYFDRIKIDRMAARPEHRVKSRADLVSSYFSFLIKRKDTVNPEFILEGETYYYAHIEKLVTNLRTMLKSIDPLIFKNYMNPFYRDLLKILISWDLKSISGNLADLQKSPRNREIRDCGNLCSMIYSPIMISSGIELKHFYAAIDRLWKLLQIVHSDDPENLIHLKNRYLDARESIKTVLKDIAYTCYPLLLKLTGSKFHFYREFVTGRRSLIMNYLRIDDDQVVNPPEDLQAVLKKQYSLRHLHSKLEKEKQKLLEEQKADDAARSEKDIENSLNLLEQLFPESRWAEFRKFPDLFPYFQPLFKFPRGTELIASEDPLQQVLVLAAVIQDLLYGFRSIKIAAEEKTAIEKASDRWHLFIDELIQNNYSKLLVEYCRNIEKGTDYTASKFGQKLLTDIYWFKRKFILPYLKFEVLYKSESIPLKAPKFHEEVRVFYSSLNSLMTGFDSSKQRQTVIENYDSNFHFEIANITSYRLKKVLDAENIAPTNENLLRYTLMLLSLLDFLINSESSPYYSMRSDEQPVYRYDPVYQGKPLYSIPLIDTETLLKKYQ